MTALLSGELMLTEGLKECVWTPKERQTTQYGRGGSGATIDLGPPYWEISLVYDGLSDAAYRALSAWLGRRRGALGHFSAYRPDRKEAANFSAEPSSPGLSDQGGEVLRVNNNAGLNLSAGDMVSYDTANGRFVGEVVQVVATASTTTDVRTLPPIVAPTTPHNLQLIGAYGHFKLIRESVQMSEPFEPKKRVSFTARQDEPH